MTQTAPIPPTFTDVDYVATGGGDPWFESEPITTPLQLQCHAAHVLARLVGLGLPTCMWTLRATPEQRHVYLYTDGWLESLAGCAGSHADVRAWAAHFGAAPYRYLGFLRTTFSVSDLVVTVYAGTGAAREVADHG